MTLTLIDFNRLTTAEDYLEYFQIKYDAQFVNINRLHILKKFSELISEVNTHFSELTETEKLDKYGEALQQAYEVFLTASPLETKLFKVFHDKPKNIVMLNDLQS
jgi:nitrogenase-stabilizing/protective protein